MGCANSRVQPEGEETDGPDVVLLKVADLLNNTHLLEGNLKSCDVLQQYWKAQQSIAGLFGPDSFTTVPWRKLESTEYGVLTYCWGDREKGAWGPTWKEMIGVLEETGKMKVEYVWIDIFCLDQNDPKKMETIRRSDKIYAWANEYHVMGLGTFKRGWCLMELGVTKAPPIIYSQHNGLHSDDNLDVRMIFSEHLKAKRKMRAALQKELRYEKAGFSVEADRAIVRGCIKRAHGDVARFEAFLVQKVLGLEQLQQFAGRRRHAHKMRPMVAPPPVAPPRPKVAPPRLRPPRRPGKWRAREIVYFPRALVAARPRPAKLPPLSTVPLPVSLAATSLPLLPLPEPPVPRKLQR